tara:strand:- start:109 stop:909 length:801 start_codon:yes stop_codon:yes gene_type:complete
MNKRIKKIFSSNSKKLVTFVTGGDPDFNTSLKIIKKLPESGVDIIEIGMPFSDPMADGPTIQLSSSRAIKKNINLEKIFSLCSKFRKVNNTTPLILMGYYNPIFYYGLKKFVNKCANSGVDGLIIVDLQPENDKKLFNLIKNNSIEFIRLVTPTTNNSRLNTILTNASGFLYYVSITGITGQKSANIKTLNRSIKKIKNKTKLPILTGFGIKNAKQAKEISSFTDGVIVGSSIVSIIEKNIDSKLSKNIIINKVSNFVKSLSRAIK